MTQKTNECRVSRQGPQIFMVVKFDDGEWRTTSSIMKFDKINGKRAVDCTDAELIADYLSGNRRWSC